MRIEITGTIDPNLVPELQNKLSAYIGELVIKVVVEDTDDPVYEDTDD